MDLNDDKRWLAMLVALIAVGAAAYWLFSPEQRALRLCDDALRAEMRSPSTYDRIDGSLSGDTVWISYDAQNGYGAVVRGRGSCTLDATGDRVIGTN